MSRKILVVISALTVGLALLFGTAGPASATTYSITRPIGVVTWNNTTDNLCVQDTDTTNGRSVVGRLLFPDGNVEDLWGSGGRYGPSCHDAYVHYQGATYYLQLCGYNLNTMEYQDCTPRQAVIG
jgi:hypothetical protein